MKLLLLLGFALPLLQNVVASPINKARSDKRYVILDNDWSPAGFIPFLLALDAGIEVLALTSCASFSSSFVRLYRQSR